MAFGNIIFGRPLEVRVVPARLRGREVPHVFEVRAHLGDEFVGSLDFRYAADLAVAPVFGVVVIEDVFGVSARRRGIATAMYAAAHDYTCRHYGVPLASDTELMPGARGYWRKQEAAGEARYDARLRRFVFVSCPA